MRPASLPGLPCAGLLRASANAIVARVRSGQADEVGIVPQGEHRPPLIGLISVRGMQHSIVPDDEIAGLYRDIQLVVYPGERWTVGIGKAGEFVCVYRRDSVV